MATVFNEQLVLGVRAVAGGTFLFNGLPVFGVVIAGDEVLFEVNERVLGIDVLDADAAIHNDQPVRGVVVIDDGSRLHNNLPVIPVRVISGSFEEEEE